MNVAPNLPGDSPPNPLLLCYNAVVRIFACILCLLFSALCGHVVHQSVDRAAELSASPDRQAYDLANPPERLGQPILFPEAKAFVNPRCLLQSLFGRYRCPGVRL